MTKYLYYIINTYVNNKIQMYIYDEVAILKNTAKIVNYLAMLCITGKLPLLCDEQEKGKRAVFSVEKKCANPSNIEPYLICDGYSSDDYQSTDEEVQ
jgi:hypothetical protein